MSRLLVDIYMARVTTHLHDLQVSDSDLISHLGFWYEEKFKMQSVIQTTVLNYSVKSKAAML